MVSPIFSRRCHPLPRCAGRAARGREKRVDVVDVGVRGSVTCESAEMMTGWPMLLLLRPRSVTRQAEHEGRPAAVARLRRDRSAMRLGELARDREAEPGALLLGR